MSLIKIIDNELSKKEKPIKAESHKNTDDIYELEHLRKLFIGGLTSSTTEESLTAYYEKWGPIVDCVVMRDPKTQRSRGFGFITYTQSDMVNKAQDARPHIVDGKEVEAKRALPRPDVGKPEINATVKKIFVGGLKDNHDESCLNEYFSAFGNVIDIKIIIDKQTGRRRGFAYIEFDDYDAVDKAVLQKVHSIKYVVVDVKKSVYKKEQDKQPDGSMGYNGQMPVHYGNQSYNQPTNWQQSQNNYNSWNNTPSYGNPNASVHKIFVGGLKDNHDDECLKEYFRQFGNVIDVKTITDKQTGRRRGFAYINFDDSNAVEKAIAHKAHSIKHVIVEVKKFSYKSPDFNKGQDLDEQSNAGAYSNNAAPIQNYSNQSYNQPSNWQYHQPNHWGNYPTPYQGGNNYGHSQSATGSIPNSIPQNNYGSQPPIGSNGPPQNNWGPQPSNFDNNYQQGYNGGPMKHNNLGGNRMNPYGPQQPAAVNQPPPSNHHGYNGGQIAAPIQPNYGPPPNYGPSANYGASMSYGKQPNYNGPPAYGKQ